MKRKEMNKMTMMPFYYFSLRAADKVIVLKEGEIVGEGTHNELIESSPVYKEIIESQLVV
ncbi:MULTISPECIES: hypothetical protein [unclassified Petrotoga]|uniref:hypothetical protein n=1 Tax=unclassified Petrotoga TaxID=2620614 RepID=UPI0018EDBA34|nr:MULTISPECIES: hypothetical protein [unclassified Petrotoga]